jgi:hypothetical protein
MAKKSKLLHELEDSELTTVQAFRRTANQLQAISKRKGQITRYTLAAIVDHEYDKHHWEAK